MAVAMQVEEYPRVCKAESKYLGLGWTLNTLYVGPERWMDRGEKWFPCGWVGKSDYCIPCAIQEGKLFLC